MPTTCKIYFEKNSNIVHPGEKVCIVVRLKLTEEIKFRSITIQLRGKTHMCFLEDDHKREGSYLANDNVLDMKKCLEGEIQHMMPGTYDYTFQYTLPHNLTSSYKGYYGHTKYTAQVTIGIPCWSDKTFKRNFIVYKSLDLNDFPELKNPVIVQEEISVLLRRIPHRRLIVMYPGGPFNISARIDHGGYVPGQFINVKGEIYNNDVDHAIHAFYVRLIRRTVYFKSENSKHHKTTCIILSSKTTNGCPQKQHKIFDVFLKVPNTPPNDTESSKLIKISYEIQMIGWMGYHERNHPRLSFPITIGTERIRSNEPAVKYLPSAPSLPTEPSNGYFVRPSALQLSDDDTVSIRTYTSTPPPFPDDELDLPTYDEAMLLNLDDDFDINLEKIQCSFAQLYSQPGKSKY